MELLGKVIGAISGFMYSKLLIVMLIGVGLFFTIATRFIQGRLFGESIRVVGEKPDQKGAVSSFQALMVSTASRVGTRPPLSVLSMTWLPAFPTSASCIFPRKIKAFSPRVFRKKS